MPSVSVLSDVLGSLRRRTSLRESIRSISSSYGSLKGRRKRTSSYQSYAVFEQTMFPIILRDPEATQRLLEAILDSPGGRRSLSRLARTCRAFEEPALNVLWRELDSLVPIIGLFPNYLLKKTRRPGLGLSRIPTESDWEKILKYGERVRKISYNEALNNVAVSIFPIFAEHRPKTYILPHLQQLVWKVETAVGLDRCALFMNSELEGLTLEIGTRLSQLSSFLAGMSGRTNLKEFSFISPTPLPDSFTELLLPQKGLQKVELVAPGALAPGIGRWLASLEDLKALQLDLTGRGVVAVEGFFDELRPRSGDSTPSSVTTTDSGVFSGEELDFSDIRKSALRLTGDLRSKGAFSSLKQLQLTGDVSNMAVFIKHLQSDLVHVELVVEDPPDAADWQDTTALLSERFGDTLQSLRISATAASRYTDLVRSTGREAPSRRLSLEHFGKLPTLTRLDIDLPESYLFTKADINHLSKICPAVQDLKLCGLGRFPTASGPPKITLEDLAPLISNCPHLHTLAAVVNATAGSAGILSSRTASSKSLLRLHVGHSWVGDSLHVTILLSHLAPHLETLKWFREKNRPGYVEAHARGWESVSEALPHLQRVRLLERDFAEQMKEAPIIHHAEYAEQSIDATVALRAFGIQVGPEMADTSVQFSPELVDRMVDASPETDSISIDATPLTVDTEIDACPEVADEVVRTPTKDKASVSSSVQALLEKRRSFAVRSHLVNMPSLFHIFALAWRLAVFFPITLPFRILHALVARVSGGKKETQLPNGNNIQKEEPSSDIEMETITDTNYDYAYATHLELRREPEVRVASWNATQANTSATRHLDQLSYRTYTMSDNKKQEKDFTPEVDSLLPEADKLVKAGKLQEALDKLFVLEKQTRNAADLQSTTRLAKAAIEHCYTVKDFTLLNSTVLLLSKKHGQLKAAIQAIVELSISWLEDIKKTHGLEKWLELVETLRVVTEGKIFLETPRARVTLLLAHYHEGLSVSSKSPEEGKKALETASELLSDLQVETYSSMERREKTEFLLEQMRLLIAVARQKDADVAKSGKDGLAGGEPEWVKVRVGGRKVNEAFLKEKDNEDLKLKFYDLMIQHALQQTAYLDVANYYYKVWETPSIKEDVADKGKTALEHIVYYVVLAPHTNEQSDMLNRLFIDPALVKLELHYNLVKCFTTRELMRWPGIQQIYGDFLKRTPVFSIEKKWEDLHTRVIEHNIRVVSQYYTRITLTRLTSLLDLTPKQTEETLARLVVSKSIWARIDRPTGIINFKTQRSSEDVMNDWSSDMQKLLGLVEKAWMGMNAAQAAQSRAVKA